MRTKYEGHTPGPWTPYADSFGCEIRERESFGTGETIARIVPLTPGGRLDEFNANAHLIAAAPKLLAENIQLAKALREIRDAAPLDGPSFVCDFDTLQSIARAALRAVEPMP